MRLQAEVAVRLLMEDYRKAHADWSDDKIPVDELVTWLGLYVATFSPMDYPQGTYGFIDPDEDENLVWLCRDLPETLHRFTLAHELGHIILHCHRGRRFQELVQRLSAEAEFITQTMLATIQKGMPDLSPIDPCHDMDVQADMTGYLDEEQFQEALGIGQSKDLLTMRKQPAIFFPANMYLPSQRILTFTLFHP